MNRLILIFAGIVACGGAWGQSAPVDLGLKPYEMAPNTAPFFNSGMTMSRPIDACCMMFSGLHGEVTINLDTMAVDLGGNTPPEAAKAFWNAVALVAGKSPIFPTKD